MSDKIKIYIAVAVLLFIIGLAWFFYKRGKKQVTLQSLPGELPGNPSSGNVTGASNDEIKSIANNLFEDISGLNFLGHNQAPYDAANLLNDADMIKLYNTFNTQYQAELEETLTVALDNEVGLGTSGDILIKRLKKLNCV